MNRLACFAACAAAFLAAPAALAEPAAYHLAYTIPIGAPDRWDYVVYEPVQDRVYIAHGDVITVVDTAMRKVSGTISVGGATHGIAAIPALGKGYADDGKAGVVVVFDLKTLKELRRIKADPDADGIVYDPASSQVLVITGDSGKVDVIDPKTDAVVAKIDGGGPLEFGVLGGNGKFYVDGEDKNEIVRMDLATHTADAHWPLSGCETPHGLAIDRAHMRLFASCGSKVMTVVDAATGKELATLPIGEGSDFATFDAERAIAFSSNRDGTLSMVKENASGDFSVLPPLATMRGARTMALNAESGALYFVSSDVTLDSTKPASDRNRFPVVPGTAKLLVFEPTR